MKKTKQTLAFELLEKEMEIIAKVDLKSIVGGESVGKITGGDGSSTNPYIISASFYYGNELSSTMKSGIDNMIFGFNNAGNIQVNGSYYKFSFGGVIASSTEQAINYAGIAGADGMSTAAIRNGSLPDNVLGTAGRVTMIIDEQKNIMTGSNILSTIRHEAGHLLGFNGGFDTSGHSNYVTGLMAPETYEGQPDDFSTLEYQNMILGIISSSGSFYSEIEPNSFGSTGVFSTGLNENGETIQNFFYYDFSDPMYGFDNYPQVAKVAGYSGYSTGYRNLITNEIIAKHDDLNLYTQSSGNGSTGAESTGL